MTGPLSASPIRRPLRVLHFICSTGFYGAEKWILALANNTDRQLISSELVVTRESPDHRLRISEEFQALDLPAHAIEASGRFDVRMIGRLTALMREREIDILHTHGYKSDILGVLAARRAGVRSICTPHGFENARDIKLRLFVWLGCQSFRFFDRVVPLSEQLCTDVRRYGVPDSRLLMIENGVDLKPIEPYVAGDQPTPVTDTETDVDMKARPGTRSIGFIGQMIDRKNIRGLIDVFDRLARGQPDLHLELIGDGAERAQVETYAATRDSASRIHFRGFVNRPLAHLSAFDLFVMTSTLEGIPRSLMEAMAMGVPVAAFDIPGVDQLVTHDATGLLARPGDNATLASHCERLLADPALAARLSQAARTQVLERFSAARMARDYTALYHSLSEAG